MEPNEGVKHDSLKLPFQLMSMVALAGLTRVLFFGAVKYAEHNWRKGMAWSRLTRALLHHTLEFAAGVDVDAESGLPTIDHIQACAHFLSEYQKRGLGNDDRVSIAEEFNKLDDPGSLKTIFNRAMALKEKK